MTYFGGKTTLAPVIAGLLPPHQHYVEPYCGSLAVLLAKSPSQMETLNDLDGALVTFWRVLRDCPGDLVRVCALTPHARAEQAGAYDLDGCDELEVARRVWVQLTQGRAGLRMRTGWRHYIKPGTFGMPDHLAGYLARIMPAAERLREASLECLPALDVIAKYGAHRDVLLYVDPPYLGSARGWDDNAYVCEMRGESDHRDLAEALHKCKSAVAISGYASDLYDRELYAGWDRHTMGASTGHRGGSRVEVLWSNRPLGQQMSLFPPGDVS